VEVAPQLGAPLFFGGERPGEVYGETYAVVVSLPFCSAFRTTCGASLGQNRSSAFVSAERSCFTEDWVRDEA